MAAVNDRTAAILCYAPVIGVFAAVWVLAARRFRENPRLRFDGFQALYLFVAWLVVNSALPTLLFGVFTGDHVAHALYGLIKVALVLSWIYLLIKAFQGQQVRLPVIGDLAARSLTEQL